jgi:hypothetical protein
MQLLITSDTNRFSKLHDKLRYSTIAEHHAEHAAHFAGDLAAQFLNA